jgi:hypothetical protein
MRNGVNAPELLRAAYDLGMRNREPALAILALELRIKTQPEAAADDWLALGKLYNEPETRDETKAMQAYQAALSQTLPADKDALLAEIPRAYRDKIQ